MADTGHSLTPGEHHIVELSDYLRILRRRWRLVVATLLLVLVAAALITWRTTPQYQSTTQLFISTSASSSAEAYQGNMERALSALYEALGSLREATPNKGGHRENAIQLVQQAISETQAGVDYADEHGGG